MKLCDFGFARIVSSPSEELTDYVATRWYRAPELLLGSTNYTASVDMWAIGCIMGEITDGQPIFPGESEVDQLYIVQRVLGPLTPEHNEIFLQNPRFAGLKFPDMSRPETLQKKYVGKLSKRALSFLRAVLSMHPPNRPTSLESLSNPYFEELSRISGNGNTNDNSNTNNTGPLSPRSNWPNNNPPPSGSSNVKSSRQGDRERQDDKVAAIAAAGGTSGVGGGAGVNYIPPPSPVVVPAEYRRVPGGMSAIDGSNVGGMTSYNGPSEDITGGVIVSGAGASSKMDPNSKARLSANHDPLLMNNNNNNNLTTPLGSRGQPINTAAANEWRLLGDESPLAGTGNNTGLSILGGGQGQGAGVYGGGSGTSASGRHLLMPQNSMPISSYDAMFDRQQLQMQLQMQIQMQMQQMQSVPISSNNMTPGFEDNNNDIYNNGVTAGGDMSILDQQQLQYNTLNNNNNNNKSRENNKERAREMEREVERERERQREREIRAFREFSTKLPLRRRVTTSGNKTDVIEVNSFGNPNLLLPLRADGLSGNIGANNNNDIPNTLTHLHYQSQSTYDNNGPFVQPTSNVTNTSVGSSTVTPNPPVNPRVSTKAAPRIQQQVPPLEQQFSGINLVQQQQQQQIALAFTGHRPDKSRGSTRPAMTTTTSTLTGNSAYAPDPGAFSLPSGGGILGLPRQGSSLEGGAAPVTVGFGGGISGYSGGPIPMYRLAGQPLSGVGSGYGGEGGTVGGPPLLPQIPVVAPTALVGYPYSGGIGDLKPSGMTTSPTNQSAALQLRSESKVNGGNVGGAANNSSNNNSTQAVSTLAYQMSIDRDRAGGGGGGGGGGMNSRSRERDERKDKLVNGNVTIKEKDTLSSGHGTYSSDEAPHSHYQPQRAGGGGGGGGGKYQQVIIYCNTYI